MRKSRISRQRSRTGESRESGAGPHFGWVAGNDARPTEGPTGGTSPAEPHVATQTNAEAEAATAGRVAPPRPYPPIAWPLAGLVGVTALLRVTSIDVAVSRLFYDARLDAWPLADEQPWSALYHYGTYPALVMGVFGVAMFFAGLLLGKQAHWKPGGLFLFLVLLLGPGVVVNGVMKECLTRPRPTQTTHFGGNQTHLPVWQPAASHDGRMNSFPSGHAAMAFGLMAPAFLLYRRRRRWARAVMATGLTFGVVMGFARIVQGRHFVSDVVWSAAVVYFTSVGVYFLLGLHREPSPAEPRLAEPEAPATAEPPEPASAAAAPSDYSKAA